MLAAPFDHERVNVRRVLLFSTTTGYQTRAFGEAAERLGVELVYATDRCNMLEDPWRDEAIPIRFHDEAASVDAVVAAARHKPIHGVLAVGDRPTVIAAMVNEALGLPGHPAAAAAVSRNKQLMREALDRAGLTGPWFIPLPISHAVDELLPSVAYPCVVKPLALSGSRGVMRANNPEELVEAVERLRALLGAPDVRQEQNTSHEWALIEGFIPGRECAVEGVMHHGRLHLFAIFDKPDPLDGPFFEETIYVTPSRLEEETKRTVARAVARAAEAIGLWHGPIHAECRVNAEAVFVLEVAARPIGGLCARTLRFTENTDGTLISFEEVLLRHAVGEPPDSWARETAASGVMMIPIPRRGVLRGVSGIDLARRIAGIDDVQITAKPDQVLIPLPEGASYLGFIFARGESPDDVERALRTAHERLEFAIDPEMRVLQSLNG